MPLSDTRIRASKPREKPYKLTDGEGLYLEVRPTGTKLWRLRYRLNGKENLFAIGPYPLIGLADARDERDKAKKLIRQGINPAHNRKIERIRRAHEHANTLEAVALEWLDRNAGRWTDRTFKQRKRGLQRDVFPHIGSLPLTQIKPAHILDVVQRIEKRAPAMAIIMNQSIGAVFRHGIATLRADSNPTDPIRGALKERRTEHRKPLTREDIPCFFEALDTYPGYPTTAAALRLMFYTLARTTEIVEAKWQEFDLDEALWVVPAERMKMREVHKIPLSHQVVALLKDLFVITGRSPCLFPSRSNFHKPASRGVLWKAVASMGYAGKFSPHGVRATGSTILNEMGFRGELVEKQLAHDERDKSRKPYNRAEYLDERREMMQHWADFIDTLRSGGKVVALGKRTTA